MKMLKQSFLLFSAFLLFHTGLQAQLPSVTIEAGYPVGRPAKQVAFGAGKYVLLTTYMYNQLFQSAAGDNWSQLSAPTLTTTQLNGLAYAAGLFVVVGDNGIIQTSPDGVSWTNRNSGTSNSLQRIYFINSKFFAIGNGRTVLTSSDGMAWTAVAFNTGAATDDFNSLSYGNGWYVLSARSSLLGGSTAIVYRSTTANNNSWASATQTPSWNGTNRIQFLNDKFWAFMIGDRMFTSPDGGTWAEITATVQLTQPDNTTTGWTNTHQIFHGVWDGTKYHFYGSSHYYRNDGSYGSTFTSTDGLNFTLLPKTAYIVPQESAIINGIHFVCGNEGIVSSTNGLSYKHSGISAYDMVKTANRYVAVGAYSNDGQIYTSTDMSNWTTQRPGTAREFYAVAYDGATLLAGGYTGLYRSTDEGDTWTNIRQNSDETFYGLAYGAGRFVMGGYDNGGTGGFIRYSTDGGLSWTNTISPDNSYMKIKRVNNRFFALGLSNSDYTGRIMTSADGISWTDATPSLGKEVYYYKDVTFDGTKFHVLGIDTSLNFFTASTTTPAVAATYGGVAVCTNTPAGVKLGGNWDQGLLEYSGGRFTGAVIDANTGRDYIITSTDGTNWQAVQQPTYSTVTAAYATGSTVQLLGRANARLTVTGGSVLPVNGLRFTATLNTGGVQVQWTTASEQKTSAFTVQHSSNSRTWASIGLVAAAGNSSTAKTYGHLHAAPVEGMNYYRLLIQNRDGSSSYSAVAGVQYGKGVAATWYPNPVQDGLHVRTGSKQAGWVTLFNGNGQSLQRVPVTGAETLVGMSGMPAGVYVVEIVQGGVQQRLSVIKN